MTYSNLKRYDQKGNRVAIFGREIEGVGLEIYVLTCSRKDFFHKDVSRNVYADYIAGKPREGFHPWITFLKVEEFSPKVTFLKWCSNHYFKEFIVDIKLKNVLSTPKIRYSHKNELFELKFLTI